MAKASTSGVTVRVVPETKRITSLFSAASTSVLPHQPSPTMPALIITTNSSNQRAVQPKQRSTKFALAADYAPPTRPITTWGQVSMARTMQHNIQNTQYSMPPITQIHFLVTL